MHQTLCAHNPEFVILITSYKNERWAADNLKSACHQYSTLPYEVVCINDCSPDRTGEIIDTYVKEHNIASKVKIIHNKTRFGALANIYAAVHSIPDHKIIVSLDGDDTLHDNNVLLRLEKEYKDPDVWLTYGSFTPTWEYLRGGLPEKIVRTKKIRRFKFVTHHLRTFKAGLFKKIRKEDLLYQGAFFPMAWDLAIMFPMLENGEPYNTKWQNQIQVY